MGQDGQLGEEWGYGSPKNSSNARSDIRIDRSGVTLTLESVILDRGLLHTISLDAFKLHAATGDSIKTPNELRRALTYICVQVGVDPLTDEEACDIWYSELNFSEFFTVVTELLTAIHRVVCADEEGIDAEVSSSSLLRGEFDI